MSDQVVVIDTTMALQHHPWHPHLDLKQCACFQNIHLSTRKSGRTWKKRSPKKGGLSHKKDWRSYKEERNAGAFQVLISLVAKMRLIDQHCATAA